MDIHALERGIFVSYRRLPDLPTAGRLFDTLRSLLPHVCIYMDVESLPAGRDFTTELSARIESCDVFLVLIGSDWAFSPTENGRSRLEDPDDLVRKEIETAFAHRRNIIPILIDKAKMPARSSLPPAIADITKLNALNISHETFARDCKVLVDKIAAQVTSARRSLEVSSAFRFETSEAQRIVSQRPPGWEYLLTAELWEDYLRPPLRRLRDMHSGVYSLRKVRITDDFAAVRWIGDKIGAAESIVAPFPKLLSAELPRAWGAPGTPGDAFEILHVCKLVERAAAVLVDWEEDVQSHEVSEKLKPACALLFGVGARQLEKVSVVPKVLRDAVQVAISRPHSDHEIHCTIEFDLPEGWPERFALELDRASSGIQ